MFNLRTIETRDLVQIRRAELKEFAIEFLEDMKEEVEERITKVAAQLNEASGRAIEDRDFSDAKWFQSAKTAKKFLGTMHQRVSRVLAEKKRTAIKGKRAWQNYFVDLVKEEWPEDFDDLVAEAKDRKEAADAR